GIADSSSMIRIEPKVVESTLWRLKTATSDIYSISYQGEFQIKRSALARIALYPYFSCMFLNDSISYRQPKSRTARLAFSGCVLGSKERIVNLGNVLRSNAGSGIGHHDADPSVVAGLDLQGPVGACHGVFGIHEQV